MIKMAKKTEDIDLNDLVQRFRDRKISCRDLQRREEERMRLAKKARQDGFFQTAELDEMTAKKIRAVRQKICLLK